jgi:hypothetical protein
VDANMVTPTTSFTDAYGPEKVMAGTEEIAGRAFGSVSVVNVMVDQSENTLALEESKKDALTLIE